MPLFLFIFFLLMVVYAILIEYYHRAWKQVPAFEPPVKELQTFISVIVPMRNEAANVQQLLHSLYQQQYPKHLYEVIIVNDHSTDDTWSLLQQVSYPDFNYQSINLADHADSTAITAHKKKSIETAIGLAKGVLIITTDADCRFHENWLYTIASFYETKQAKFIAAPVKITTNRSVLSVFQSLDFITLQGITAASVYKRFHSMCNGANLAYERSAFYEVNGFAGIDNIPTGDDMLLMHKIFKRYPEQVFYLKNTAAIVTTTPALTWKEFFHQRIRWASKADRFDDKRIFWVLLLVYIVNVCFLVTAIAGCWKDIWLFFGLLLLVAKVLIEFLFVQSVARFFGQSGLMKYFPLLQPLHILYTIIAGWFGKFGKYEWKGRQIKR
ncbi:MAG: glycosyltransferase [Chitinophagaceae bacterium]